MASQINGVGCGRSLDAVLRSEQGVKEQFDIGKAILALKAGKRVSRLGWNGNYQYLVLVQPPQSATPSEHMYDVELAYVRVQFTLRPWIAIKTVGDELMPWVASQSDILAQDWSLSDEMQKPV